MLSLYCVLKASRRRKKDGDISQHLPIASSVNTTTSNSDAKKKRKTHHSGPKVISSTPSIQSSLSTNSTSTTSTVDTFNPRRSKRLTNMTSTKGDGDTWIECRIVNIKDRKSEKNKTRSLFYSVETQKGWWDEPPSGASNVIYIGQGKGLEVVRKNSSSRKRWASFDDCK